MGSSLESSLEASPASSWPPPGRRPGRLPTSPGLLLPTSPGLLPGALLASLTSLPGLLLASSRPPPEDLGHQVSLESSREPPEHFLRGRRKWRSHYKLHTRLGARVYCSPRGASFFQRHATGSPSPLVVPGQEQTYAKQVFARYFAEPIPP